MRDVAFDLRYGWRSLIRTPGLTGVALLTLALGVGVNVSVFAFISALFFGPIPFEDPDRVAYVWSSDQAAGRDRQGVSPADLRDWRRYSETFEYLAGFESRRLDLSGDPPERLLAVEATAGFLSVLGETPHFGTDFRADREGEDGCEVLLSHGLWQRRFGGDGDVVGGGLRLGGESCTVVGVMGPGFWFPSREVDLWRRYHLEGRELDRFRGELQVIGLLAPSASLAEAQAELRMIAARLERSHPETNEGRGVEVVPISLELLGPNDRMAIVLLAMSAGFILLITCANVANLLLARSAGRQGEMGVRIALGARRGRLIRQLLAESLVLTLMAGAVGVLFARWAAAILVQAFPHSTPDPTHVVDGGVLLFALVVSLAIVPLFGLLPALRSSKVEVRAALQESEATTSAGRQPRRLAKLLVVGEATLALALLAVCGLMIRTLMELQRVDPGFDTDDVVMARLDLSSREQGLERVAFLSGVIERIGSLPEVDSASVVSRPPFAPGSSTTRFAIDGVAGDGGESNTSADVLVVGRGYFDTLGITVVQGRGFPSGASTGAEPVAWVNEALARRHAPPDGALGMRIRLAEPDGAERGDEWLTVVGVVEDVRYRHTAFDPQPQVFLPYDQSPIATIALLVRTRTPEVLVADAMRDTISRLDPGRPLYDVQRLDAALADLLAVPRTFVALLGAFGVVALLLAGAGVCGVVSNSVGQRMQEIAVRQAMGADSRDIRRLVLWEGGKLALAGAGTGLLLALALGRLMSGMLYGIRPHDPLTFGVVTVFVSGLVLVASWLPARRATRLEVWGNLTST